jgi:uncharacterized protein involved in propanediol utilization
MSQRPGTPEAPSLVLRLSVPASDGFRSFAADLAVKVATYLGLQQPDASSVATTITSLMKTIEPKDESTEMTFEFHQREGELRIEARCGGRTSHARHPLPL